MNADADIQVWLETFSRSQPSIIIPYVKSTEEKTLYYRVSTSRVGVSGHSATAQSGTVHTAASKATALSQFSISRSSNDTCQIKILLLEAGKPERQYQFNCPD